MPKITAVIVFIYVFSLPALAQNREKIKQLKQSLTNANDDARFDKLTQLAWEFRVAFPDSGIYYGQKAFELGQTLKRKDIGRPLNFIGLSYHHKGDNLVAYEYYKQSLDVARKNDDWQQAAHANNNIGRLFMEQGLYDKSLAHYQAAKSIFATHSDSSGLAYSLQGLGSYYLTTSNFVESERVYQQAYTIRKKLGNNSELTTSMMHIGKLYEAEGKVDDALLFYKRADSLGGQMTNMMVTAEANVHIAACLLKKGNLQEALQRAKEGLAEIFQSQNIRLLPEAYLTMGQIQHKLGNLTEAKAYFKKTLSVSPSRNDLATRLEAYFLLWQTSKSSIENSDELEHYTNYLLLKDSIRSLTAAQRENQLTFQMSIEQRESENKILKANEGRKNAIISVMVLFVLAAILIVLLLLRNKTRILRINHLLEERNRQIKLMNETLEDRVKQRTELLEAKNRSLMEYNFINSHLLRGPLASLLGLINLIDQDKVSHDANLIALLRKSGNDLDEIVKKITSTLSEGESLTVDRLRNKPEEKS